MSCHVKRKVVSTSGLALWPCSTLGHTAPIQVSLFANTWHHLVLSSTKPHDMKIYLCRKKSAIVIQSLLNSGNSSLCKIGQRHNSIHQLYNHLCHYLTDGRELRMMKPTPPLGEGGWFSKIEPRVHYSGVSLPPYPPAPCSSGWSPRPAHPRAGPPTMTCFRPSGPLCVNRFITAVHILWGLGPNLAPLLCFWISRIMCNVTLINACSAFVVRTKMPLKFLQIHSIFILEMYGFLYIKSI